MPNIECPNCNSTLKIRNADVGRTFRCPRCKGTVEGAASSSQLAPVPVPSVAETPVSADEPATPAPARPDRQSDTVTFFCTACGNRIVAPLSASGKTGSCNVCGAPVSVPSNQAIGMTVEEPVLLEPMQARVRHQTSDRNKTTAGIFALLLGGIGVHKFYHGSWGWGILYVLFFWTYIPAILALIEGIIYLTMDDAKYNAKYNHDDQTPFKW